MFNEQFDGIAIANRRNRRMSLDAEEGRITGSFESGKEACSSTKSRKILTNW
jgi:hypothetical protein